MESEMWHLDIWDLMFFGGDTLLYVVVTVLEEKRLNAPFRAEHESREFSRALRANPKTFGLTEEDKEILAGLGIGSA